MFPLPLSQSLSSAIIYLPHSLKISLLKLELETMAISPFLTLLFSLTIASHHYCAAAAGDSSGELWCVAKNNAEDSALQAALDWACGPGGADCSPIQQGGPCYDTSDLQSLASFAFNDYFIRHGSDLTACDFSGTAAPISLNPSHDKCNFPSSSSPSNGNFSGSSHGSTGMGPDGADLNAASNLQLMHWLWASSLSMLILYAFGRMF